MLDLFGRTVGSKVQMNLCINELHYNSEPLIHFYLINGPAGEGDQTYLSWVISGDSSFYLQYCFVPNASKNEWIETSKKFNTAFQMREHVLQLGSLPNLA